MQRRQLRSIMVTKSTYSDAQIEGIAMKVEYKKGVLRKSNFRRTGASKRREFRGGARTTRRVNKSTGIARDGRRRIKLRSRGEGRIKRGGARRNSRNYNK